MVFAAAAEFDGVYWTLTADAGGGSYAIQTGRRVLRLLSGLGQALRMGQVHPGRESTLCLQGAASPMATKLRLHEIDANACVTRE